MPKKTKRIIMVLVILISAILVFGYLMGPGLISMIVSSQKDTLKSNPLTEKNYVDASLCKKCHFAIDSLKMNGSHKKLNCQYCHGPGYEHILSPSKNRLKNPTEKKFCEKCHAKNAIRLTKIIRQIDITKHNSSSATCIKCHDPHTPMFKSMVSGQDDTKQDVAISCTTCHEDVYKLQSAGKHKSITCQKCHTPIGVPENAHVLSPSSTNISKSGKPEFCGKCHATGNASSKTKQIDPKEHNPDMICIECHSAHNPPEFK